MKGRNLTDADMHEALVRDSVPTRRRKRRITPTGESLNLTIILGCTSGMLMLYGYDFGITAWTVLDIKARGVQDISPVYVYLYVHEEILGLLVACVAIGGFCGGIAGRFMHNVMGRKAEIRLVNMLCILGSMLEGLSGTVTWTHTYGVLAYALGRLIYGFGLGLSLRCGPMYLREAVPDNARDAAMMSIKLSMVMGMIVSYVVGGVIDTKLYGYFGGVIIASVSLVLLTMIPESPMFMLLHEDLYSREQVLGGMRFANPKVTKDDVLQLKDEVLTETLAYTPGWSQMSPVEDACTIARLQGRAPRTPCSKDSVGTNGSNGHNPSFDDSSVEKKEVLMREAVQNLPSIIKAPGMRASLLLTAGLMVFEQGSGMTALFYYGAVFLDDIDVISVDIGLALLGVIQLVMVFVVMYGMNAYGRKPLLLWGNAGMAVSAAILALGAFLGVSTRGRWLVLVGLYAFATFYSLSLGALVWVLVSEVFPTCHRAQAISIVSAAHFAVSASVNVALPVMQEELEYSGMFCVFFTVCVLANIFSHRFMVETRGLTLLEVQRALTMKAGFELGPGLI